MHGQDVGVAWTQLSETAEVGDTSIRLQDAVNSTLWKVCKNGMGLLIE